MSEERKFFSGNTLEQAILQAARHYEVEPERLAYQQIEKKYGFLKTRRRIVIQVDPAAPEKTESETGRQPPEAPKEPLAAAVSAPERPRPLAERRAVAAEESVGPEAGEPAVVDRGEDRPAGRRRRSRSRGRKLVQLPDAPRRALERYPAAEGPLADAAREALEYLFELSDLELESSVLQGDDTLEIELWGEDQEELLRDRGRLLLSYQHLLPRIIRGIAGDSIACRVDCDGFHEIRAEQLRDLAQRVASEVKQSGREKVLDPMSPDERRIVHMTLTDDPTVETHSKGHGLFKRVTVRPID